MKTKSLLNNITLWKNKVINNTRSTDDYTSSKEYMYIEYIYMYIYIYVII